jgi:hypothetical protein
VFGLDRYQPFTRTVPPGRYPVALCVSQHTYPNRTEERVAAAMIRFTKAKPAAWEMTLRPGEDPATLLPGQFFGYGVDGGEGCFTDAHAVETLEPERKLFSKRSGRQPPPNAGSEYYRNLRTPFFRRLDESRREWAANEVADPDTGANLIAFSSGWGDGAYPSFWGLDRAGNPCRLATDFGILLESFDEKLTFPLGRGERTFRHPELAARGITAIHVTEETEDPSPFERMRELDETLRELHEKMRELHGIKETEDRALRKLPPVEDYRLTVQVRVEGEGGCLGEPRLRCGGRQYHVRMIQGTEYRFYLDQPLSADAKLVITYLARTVPL